MEPSQIRNLITTAKEPLVLRGFLKWKMLDWDLEKWESVLGDQPMEFHTGQFKPTRGYQQTGVLQVDFKSFMQHAQSGSTDWLYYDYKYLQNNLTHLDELRRDINWSALGYPCATADQSTIWIGSKYSHTPCHMDTYGYNLFHQVYGRKLWVLIPPSENLKPTRIPYEESTYFSKLNFFSPILDDFKDLKNAQGVILHPGDVLYVPRHWWHYVENIETSISINSWQPTSADHAERVKESIVRILIKSLCDSTDVQTALHVVNRNSIQLFLDKLDTHVEMAHKTKRAYRSYVDKIVARKVIVQPAHFIALGENICGITKLSDEEFRSFIEKQLTRFGEEQMVDNINHAVNRKYIDIFETLTDPEVVHMMAKKFLSK